MKHGCISLIKQSTIGAMLIMMQAIIVHRFIGATIYTVPMVLGFFEAFQDNLPIDVAKKRIDVGTSIGSVVHVIGVFVHIKHK